MINNLFAAIGEMELNPNIDIRHGRFGELTKEEYPKVKQLLLDSGAEMQHDLQLLHSTTHYATFKLGKSYIGVNVKIEKTKEEKIAELKKQIAAIEGNIEAVESEDEF